MTLGGISVGVFNQGIDFNAIGSEMANTAHLWMNASVDIVDPNTGSGTWDVYTNTETGETPTVLWSGPARVQHVGGNANPNVGYVQTGVHQVRVQVPLDVDAGFIRKGLQVRVTNPGNDYALEDMVFTVIGTINSSYAWLRTIMCEADLKLGPQGD